MEVFGEDRLLLLGKLVIGLVAFVVNSFMSGVVYYSYSLSEISLSGVKSKVCYW